jgi:hypothetical protein
LLLEGAKRLFADPQQIPSAVKRLEILIAERIRARQRSQYSASMRMPVDVIL